MKMDWPINFRKTLNRLQRLPGAFLQGGVLRRSGTDSRAPRETSRVEIRDGFFRPSLGLPGWLARKILALDFQEDRVVYALLQRLGKQMALQKAGAETFRSSGQVMENAWAEAVSNILKHHYKTPMEVWVSFSHPAVTSMEMVFPVVSETQELEKAIYFQLKSEVEGFKEDRFIWLYRIMGTFEEDVIQQQRILVVLVPRRIIQQLIKIFAPFHIHPELLIPRQLVLLQSYGDMVAHASNALFIDVGQISSLLFLYRKGRPVFCRQMAFGVQEMESTAGHNGRIHEPFFKRLDESHHPLREHPVGERLEKFLADYHLKTMVPVGGLYAEILRTLEYAHKHLECYGLDNIFVSGLGANSPELIAFLSRELSMPILPLIPNFPVGGTPVPHPSQFIGFIGFPAYTRLRRSFVPPEVRRARLLKKVNLALAGIFVLANIVVGSLALKVREEVDLYRRNFQSLQHQFALLAGSNREFRAALTRKVRYQNRLQELEHYLAKRTEILPLLQYFSQQLPPEMVLDELHIYHLDDGEEKFPVEVPVPENSRTAIQLIGKIHLRPIASESLLLGWMNRVKEASVFRSVQLIEKGVLPENNHYRFNLVAFR